MVADMTDKTQKIINWLKPRITLVTYDTNKFTIDQRYFFHGVGKHWYNLNDYVEDRFGSIDNRTMSIIVSNFKRLKI